MAFDALDQYRQETGDTTTALVVSTASPFKFCDSVLEGLGIPPRGDGLDLLDALAERTGMHVPAPLAGLRDKKVRFEQVVEKDCMADAVRKLLE